ncbi:pseudouridylate synthase 4 [Fistulina hepatica ATCC 64428]|nr:pseudouridylate synthase 4 [Fistulina hepatica ATCC 64428]
MPKADKPVFPVSGLFGIVKPSGPTSMSLVNDVQRLVARSRIFVPQDKIDELNEQDKKSRGGGHKRRNKRPRDVVKVGQGGTLDPLADGVLVIGVGKGTKKLTDFLHCTKEYRATCLLGCETDTYDSEGAQVRQMPWKHVTREMVEAALPKLTGNILQVPPIFSALKMDGKPLYEYARKGLPLPRKIEARPVTVHRLEIVQWIDATDSSWQWPSRRLSDDERTALAKTLRSVEVAPAAAGTPALPPAPGKSSTAFVLHMTVSSGTYVRTIAHDLAHLVGSAGHIVTLQRARQGRFRSESTDDVHYECVPWEVFERALKDPAEKDEEGWTEWERAVLSNLEIVP